MKETGKRILALVMALCLTLALGTTALAAEEPTSITTVTTEPAECKAGVEITKITLEVDQGSFASSLEPASSLFKINGISGASVQSATPQEPATKVDLTLSNCIPTAKGTFTVTVEPGAFEETQPGEALTSPTVNIAAAATPSDVSFTGGGGSLFAGQSGTITVSSSSNHFVNSPSYDLFIVKVGEAPQTVTSAGSGGASTELSFTPTTTGAVSVEVKPGAFTYQPEGNVNATGSLSVSAPTVTATASGELTQGKAGDQITVTINSGNDTFKSLTVGDTGLFTVKVNNSETVNVTNVTGSGESANLTMDAPQTTGAVTVEVKAGAFTYAPQGDTVTASGATVKAPTGTVSAALEGGELYAGTAVSGQKIKLTAKPNLTFADEAKKENFSLVETNDISGLTIEDAKGSGDTVTLTLGGTPSKDGTFKVKAEVAAFKYQPTGAITTEDSITVKPAPDVTLSGTEIVAGNTDKITVSISTPQDTVKFTKNDTTYFTVSGIDDIATKSVAITGEGKSVEITLSAVPTHDGTLNVKVSKDAFTPVAKGETVTATVTVSKPTGEVTGSLDGGTLTAGTPAGATKIKLSVAGTTLNFKNTLDNAPFTLNGAEGLSIESVAVTDNGKTATLTLSGTPKSQGTFTVTVAETAFVASPGSSKTTTGAPLTINYPTVTVTPDPNFIAEDDETATSIKLKATGSVFNATDEMTYFQISGVSGNITLTGVHADANSDTATLTISGTANGEGTLEITIKPDAFVYKPEGDVKANIRVGKPTGTLTATQNGKLYKGTPVSGQTITVNITESHGLHFKADLTAGDFGLTGASAGLTIKEAKFVNTLEATLTLEGTPEQNGVFQVKALTNAFHVAPAGEQPATGDITVEDAPTGSVTAAPSGLLYAGTPADGTTVTLTASNLTFAAAVKDNFTLTGTFADMTIADAKLSDGKIVLTLSGTPAAAGTFQVKVAQKAFTVYPAADVNSDNITVGAANIKLALSDNGLQAGKENMTFKVTPSGGKLIDLANRAAAIDTGADLDGLTLGDMTQNADGSVTVAIMGMPPVAGSITITFQASMFSPAPEGPVSLTVPVAEGEQAAEPETKPGAPGIGFTAPMDELAASVLTPEEQALYEKGAQVLIELVESPDAQVPEADKTVVTNAAGEYTVGEYLDVSLIKTINGVSDTVSETNRAIRVVFTIPTDLQAAGRQFAVIRVHDGKAEFLKTVSSTASTITVESDRFSTYAIVYREAPATATPAPTQTSTATPAPTDSVPDTGDDTALPGWTALLLGCAAALTAAVLTLRRKDRRG